MGALSAAGTHPAGSSSCSWRCWHGRRAAMSHLHFLWIIAIAKTPVTASNGGSSVMSGAVASLAISSIIVSFSLTEAQSSPYHSHCQRDLRWRHATSHKAAGPSMSDVTGRSAILNRATRTQDHPGQVRRAITASPDAPGSLRSSPADPSPGRFTYYTHAIICLSIIMWGDAVPIFRLRLCSGRGWPYKAGLECPPRSVNPRSQQSYRSSQYEQPGSLR